MSIKVSYISDHFSKDIKVNSFYIDNIRDIKKEISGDYSLFLNGELIDNNLDYDVKDYDRVGIIRELLT